MRKILTIALFILSGVACVPAGKSTTPSPDANSLSPLGTPRPISDMRSLERVMKDIIRPGFGLSDVPLLLTVNSPSDIEYINGMLQETGFSASQDFLEARTLHSDLEDRVPSLMHVFTRYDNSGHALAYALSPTDQKDALGVWIVLRGITPDSKNFIFDNPVDADGEMTLPFEQFLHAPYIRLDRQSK